jgi:uncharacterized protein YjbI with pentapeptide repeats
MLIEMLVAAATQAAVVMGTPAAPGGYGGFNLNGTSLNGISVQGISIQGVGLNGFTLNGFTLNGFTLNGFTLNGFTLNGTKPLGLNVGGHQGVSLNGQVIAIEF